jgi:hypothetical protein
MLTRTLHSLLLTALLLPLLAGCGPSRPETVPVTGKITYGGGPWPTKGTIYFVTKQAAKGFPGRPGQADFSPDGSFSVESFEGTPGLMPGTYAIRVECWEVAPSMESSTLAKSWLPKELAANGLLKDELVIEPGSAAKVVNLDVPKR